MEEIWVDVKGYETLYQVSNLGNVRSLDRIDSSNRHLKGRVLSKARGSYLKVSLSKGNCITNHNVHRLVAEAFLPNPNNYPCVNHKDENKYNNVVTNLEWCTYGYNNLYSGVTEKASQAKLGKHLSPEHKRAISETLKKNASERVAKRLATMKERYPDGFRLSDEQRKKLSESLRGKPKSEEAKQHMRKPKSPETVERMRQAQREAWKRRKEQEMDLTKFAQ